MLMHLNMLIITYKYYLIFFMNKIYYPMIIIIFMIIINFYINNKILLWMTMEISSFSMISILIFSKELIPSIIYFLISFMSSMIMFVGLIYYNIMNPNLYLMFSIMLKISLFPLNFWFITISKSMNYLNLMIMMTFMKFIPMNIMHMLIEMNIMLFMMSMISITLSPILALNKKSIKIVFSYSSIQQTSFMILIMYMNFNMFIIYFMFYSLITYMLFMLINTNNLKTTNNITKWNNKNKFLLLLMIIIYSYFPPMISFTLKWMLIQNMIIYNYNLIIYTIIIMLSSFAMTWNYLTVINNYMYFNTNYNKKFKLKKNTSFNMKFIMKCMFMSLLMSLMYYYMYTI